MISKNSAKKYFLNQLHKKNSNVMGILNNDKFLLHLNLPIDENDKSKLIYVFDKINDLNGDKKTIDLLIKIYLSGNLGFPNSLENIGRFKDNIKKYKYLKDNKYIIKNKHEIKSLKDLEKLIDDNKEILESIEIKKQQRNKKKDKHLSIKEKGEHDVKIELETNNLIVYVPTSINGSQYYGSNTKWCTASLNDNVFETYNKCGELYIVQLKYSKLEKYQIHLQTLSIMDASDEPVTLDKLFSKINDNIFSDFIETKLINWMFVDVENLQKNMTLETDGDIECVKYGYEIPEIFITKNILKHVTMLNVTNENFGMLCHCEKIKSLIFQFGFNQQLGNSLNKLTTLRKIVFKSYDIPLEDSLKNLINLEILEFGCFNRELGVSLNNLPNLKTLKFGLNFNVAYLKDLSINFNIIDVYIGPHKYIFK